MDVRSLISPTVEDEESLQTFFDALIDHVLTIERDVSRLKDVPGDRDVIAELFRAVVADEGEDELRTLATELVKAQHGVMGGGVEAPADLSDNEKKAVEVQIATLRSPWFKRFLSTDPRDILEKVTVPVLAVNGSLDVQVSADENIRGIEQALRRAGNKDVTTRVFPGLNHLFQRCVDLENFDPKDPARWSKGAVSWYATNPETMNDDVMKFVQEWIVQRFPTPAPGAPDPSGQGGR